MKLFAYAALAALLATVPAAAQQTCAPVDMAARVLQSANPNDLHADWTGENRIGTSWSLIVASEVTDEVDSDVTYLQGSLVDPQGNEAGNVFAVKREWTCS